MADASTQYRRSLYAEYAVCVGHQLPEEAPSQLLKRKKKEKRDTPFPHLRPWPLAAECKWS